MRRWFNRRLPGQAIEYISVPTAKPRLVRRSVVSALHRFSEDVRKVPSEAGNFLLKPRASASHQLFIALVPQFVAMRESAWNAVACGFDDVLIDGFGLQWRQFAVPVDDFAIAADCSHDSMLVPGTSAPN